MMNNYDLYYDYQNNRAIFNNMADLNKINQTSQTANKDLVEPYTAFIRGNLFNKLYDQYKNYKPAELNPTNEQEQMLLLVQMYTFCAHELTLYLDNYPNDSNAIKLREEYMTAARNATNQYEAKYGPLNLSSNTLGVTPWAWDTKKWPWEGSY